MKEELHLDEIQSPHQDDKSGSEHGGDREMLKMEMEENSKVILSTLEASSRKPLQDTKRTALSAAQVRQRRRAS